MSAHPRTTEPFDAYHEPSKEHPMSDTLPPAPDMPPQHPAAPPLPERLLRSAEVMQRLGIRKTKLYTGIKAGTIPAPRRLTRRSVCWPESVIAALVEDIKQGRHVL